MRFWHFATMAAGGLLALGACNTDFEDGTDFAGAGGGFGEGEAVGTGSFGECSALEEFHATILHNGDMLRADSLGPVGPLANDELVLRGGVVSSTPTSLSLDACAVTPCKMADVYDVSFDASGIEAPIPPGTFVEVDYLHAITTDSTGAMHAGYALAIVNLPSLDGTPNPKEASSSLWFEGMRGLVPEAPVVATLSLASTCSPINQPSAIGHDLVAEVNDDSTEHVRVAMGQSSQWNITSGPFGGIYVVTNLASITTGEAPDVAMAVARP
jgi:hypothetical protein